MGPRASDWRSANRADRGERVAIHLCAPIVTALLAAGRTLRWLHEPSLRAERPL